MIHDTITITDQFITFKPFDITYTVPITEEECDAIAHCGKDPALRHLAYRTRATLLTYWRSPQGPYLLIRLSVASMEGDKPAAVATHIRTMLDECVAKMKQEPTQ